MIKIVLMAIIPFTFFLTDRLISIYLFSYIDFLFIIIDSLFFLL